MHFIYLTTTTKGKKRMKQQQQKTEENTRTRDCMRKSCIAGSSIEPELYLQNTGDCQRLVQVL
jgi:hypothetical protein